MNVTVINFFCRWAYGIVLFEIVTLGKFQIKRQYKYLYGHCNFPCFFPKKTKFNKHNVSYSKTTVDKILLFRYLFLKKLLKSRKAIYLVEALHLSNKYKLQRNLICIIYPDEKRNIMNIVRSLYYRGYSISNNE